METAEKFVLPCAAAKVFRITEKIIFCVCVFGILSFIHLHLFSLASCLRLWTDSPPHGLGYSRWLGDITVVYLSLLFLYLELISESDVKLLHPFRQVQVPEHPTSLDQ